SGSTDLVILEGERGVRRLTPNAERPTWEILWNPPHHRGPSGAQAYGLTDEALRLLQATSRFVVAPAPDVNGDGTRDLLWTGAYGLLAMSGKDGAKLWLHSWQPQLPSEAKGQKLKSYYGN